MYIAAFLLTERFYRIENFLSEESEHRHLRAI